MAVQGEIKRPNTAPTLTMARIMTTLCNQTLGTKNHVNPTATETITAMVMGIQKTSAMNIPQANKKAKIILKTYLNTDIGIRRRAIPSTITMAKK